MNTAVCVQDILEKETRKLDAKWSLEQLHISLQDLSKGKVIQNICFACPVSFNNIRVTMNGLDKMHILN